MANETKRFLDSEAGRELKEYLFKKLDELKDIENLKEIDTPTHQSIEIKSQRRAYLKLKEILSEIMTTTRDSAPKDPRDSFSMEIDD